MLLSASHRYRILFGCVVLPVNEGDAQDIFLNAAVLPSKADCWTSTCHARLGVHNESLKPVKLSPWISEPR